MAALHSVSMALAAPLMAMLHYQQGRYAEAELLTPLLPLIDNTAMHEALSPGLPSSGQHGVPARAARSSLELLERAEAMGYNRGWDRLVGTMLLDRIRLLVFERRLTRPMPPPYGSSAWQAAQTDSPLCPRGSAGATRYCGRPELPWPPSGINEARSTFSSLLQAAQASSQDLRPADWDPLSHCPTWLAENKKRASHNCAPPRSTAQRRPALCVCVDEGNELYSLLPRFLVSPGVRWRIDRLRTLPSWQTIHTGHGVAPKAQQHATAREIRVIELVEQGSSTRKSRALRTSPQRR